MTKFSFLHISDIHLGRTFSGLNKISAENDISFFKNVLERVLKKITDFAVEKNVDFVLIAGDTFDLEEQDFASKLIFKRVLLYLDKAKIGVYAVCGNHDPLVSYNKTTFNFDENSRIKIIGLNTPKCVKIPVFTKNGEEVATLHAFSFVEEKFNSNPLQYFEQAQDGFNIGLLHCDLNADCTSPYAPCTISELKALNYDYYALGHIHLPSENSEIVQYSGTVQGRNTKETGKHGIRYIEVENNIIKKNMFVPTDIVRYEDVTADITSANNALEAFDIIEDKIGEKMSDEVEIFLVKLNIKGCSSCFDEINEAFLNVLYDKIKEDFSSKVYFSDFQINISPKTDDNVLKEDTGIAGEIYRCLEDDELLQNSFLKTEEKIKNFIKICDFLGEEYKNFRENVIKRAKEECKNLSNLVV